MASTQEASTSIIKSDRAGLTCYTQPYKDEVVAAYRQRNMSAAAFAEHCGVKYPTFASWVAKARHPEVPQTTDIKDDRIPIPNPNQFANFRYQQSRFFSSVSAWKERNETLMLLDPIIGGYGMNRLSPEMPPLLNSVNMASFHGVNIFTSYLPRKPSKGAKGYTQEEYRFLNEYIGRMTQVLRGAKRDAGVGLYYPIAMFQGDLLASRERWGSINNRHKKRQQDWDKTELALLKGDIEYMIVHPEGVAQAQVAKGQPPFSLPDAGPWGYCHRG